MDIIDAVHQMGTQIAWMIKAALVAACAGGVVFIGLAEYWQQRSRSRSRMWKDL